MRHPLLVLVLLGGLICLSSVVLAAPAPTAAELRKLAGEAYTAGRFAEAEAINLEIIRRPPARDARRYAILMLADLYENHLVDLEKAIELTREYLATYADHRQRSFYQQKLQRLTELLPQEQAFREYQAIRHADEGDAVAVKRYEALLAAHPDFLLKAGVLKELGHAYVRLDQRWHSYRAFKALFQTGESELSPGDREAYDKASRHWRMTLVWGGGAWAVVVALWAVALLMRPWPNLNRPAFRTYLLWALLWLLLSASRLPPYYALEGENLFTEAAVYVAAGLNMAVLFWLFLLLKGTFWRSRPRALLWLSPVLAMLMTTAVSTLFFIYQPNGAEIVDAFAAKYRYLAERPSAPLAAAGQEKR